MSLTLIERLPRKLLAYQHGYLILRRSVMKRSYRPLHWQDILGQSDRPDHLDAAIQQDRGNTGKSNEGAKTQPDRSTNREPGRARTR